MTDASVLSYLEVAGVPDAALKAGKLSQYVDEILLFNPTYKLVGEKTREEVVLRHILDSASAYFSFLSATAPGDTVLDLGSGAGLPGVVLAILLPDRKFILVERMTRRVGFLRNVKAVLSLSNVEISDSDASDAPKGDLVTYRAFRPLPEIAGVMASLSRKALLYKGKADSVIREMEETNAVVPLEWKMTPLCVEGEEGGRHLVHIEWK